MCPDQVRASSFRERKSAMRIMQHCIKQSKRNSASFTPVAGDVSEIQCTSTLRDRYTSNHAAQGCPSLFSEPETSAIPTECMSGTP